MQGKNLNLAFDVLDPCWNKYRRNFSFIFLFVIFRLNTHVYKGIRYIHIRHIWIACTQNYSKNYIHPKVTYEYTCAYYKEVCIDGDYLDVKVRWERKRMICDTTRALMSFLLLSHFCRIICCCTTTKGWLEGFVISKPQWNLRTLPKGHTFRINSTLTKPWAMDQKLARTTC